MSDELKPCPYCGHEPDSRISDTDGNKYYTCGSKWCRNGNWYTLEEWNTRPLEDALNARIAELEAEVTKCHELQDSYCDRIAELESAQRWRVVADGESPETYRPVLTVDMSEATQIPVPAFYNPDTECWSTHFKYDLWVTHWMPLPELPERENER